MSESSEQVQGGRSHWENVYATRDSEAVSWFQKEPTLSLEMIQATELPTSARIVDVGGGASRLVDRLLDAGFKRPGVLDHAEAALDVARERLGGRARDVEWIRDDVLASQPAPSWDCWHDRALFHFLTDPDDRAAYRESLLRAVPSGGHVIIAAFGPDGPGRCSGLDTLSCSAEDIAAELGSAVGLIEHREEEHYTPSGGVQPFVYARFERV